MSEQTVRKYVFGRGVEYADADAEAQTTKDARRAKVVVGDAARVTRAWSDSESEVAWVGRETTIERIDQTDARLTFFVKDADGDKQWVHDVEPLNVGGTKEVSPLDGLQALVAQLTTDVQEQRQRANELNTKFIAFQQQVRDVAIRVAEEQTWCDHGLNEVLTELGLEKKDQPEYEVEVTVTFTLKGRPNQEPTEEWVRHSITGLGDVGLDGDWDDLESDYSIDSVSLEEA